MEEPDSIKTNARRPFVREVLFPVGKERISSLMVDMAAFADKYPSVAAALKEAKLTPQQHDAIRAALASAFIYQYGIETGAEHQAGADSVRAFLGIDPASALAKNLEFISTHPDELASLEAAEMWQTP